ncbi:adenylate/guanylate cyclase domain-containing protein [Nocardioides panacisoli]|uniref:Guanylate cyclase domain-containing protein n=1 Tax=Nocardioides panacisoli TaxID=627624 RepID=A0ABP7J3Z8_9ACTN
MRFWDLSDADVEAIDAEPWDGPLVGLVRPMTLRSMTRIYLAGTFLALQAALMAFLFGLLVPDELRHPHALVAMAVVLLVVGVLIPVGLVVLPGRTIRRWTPATGTVITLSMGILSTGGIWASGPHYAVVVVFYFEALPFAFYALRLRWALLGAADAVVGCGLVMFLQDGWAHPALQWLTAVSTIVAVAMTVGLLAERADRLAASEHAARVELDEVNRTLEDRVAEQVGEIERLGGLRRFLTPQVADAVLSADADAVMRPHRARIAVFFCDLRGFTAFTKDSEPEEVVADLDLYYRTVGEVLQRHGATIGGYAGDGIMAYFGDPVPHPEPARAAGAMVAELRRDLDALVAEWHRRGHDLSYGVGLACGYATLGVVGFDGRFDYTPLGGVVNLAARLCGKAAAGQVLVDHATYADLDGTAVCTPVEGLELKGLGEQRAYALA